MQVRHGSPEPVPLRIEAGLYRITRESLANVRKHAYATRVEIELRTTSQDVRLSIRDDGVGFDPGYEATDGQGLPGMRERVKLLDGRLRLRSQPGRGTMTSPEGKPLVRSGYTLTILQKNRDGGWVIARDANLLASEVNE